MFGIGFGEMILILIAAVIFIGPKDLPKLGSKLGKFFRAFNLAKHEFTEQLRQVNLDIEKEKAAIKAQVPSVAALAEDLKSPLISLSQSGKDEAPPSQKGPAA